MKKVLAIEDEVYMMKLYEETLAKGDDFEVIAKTSWETAAPILESEEIDLLLLDVELPGKNGFEILKEVKKKYPKLPIIMITAYGSQQTMLKARAGGVSEFITKPFKIPSLREKIKNFLS